MIFVEKGQTINYAVNSVRTNGEKGLSAEKAVNSVMILVNCVMIYGKKR